MNAFLGESLPGHTSDAAVLLSELTEAIDIAQPRMAIRPAVHPLAAKLGRLLTNPRVTGDFFQTVWCVRIEVNAEIPPREAVAAATFLLRWFGQTRTRPAPAMIETPQPAAQVRPVLDAAAQELALQRSIEAARTYNMAHDYGLAADAAAVAQFYPQPDQLIQ